jgi:hypothetical protein
VRVGNKLPSLNQQPAKRIPVVVLLEIAIVARQFDDLFHLLEGQVTGTIMQPGNQVSGLLGTAGR